MEIRKIKGTPGVVVTLLCSLISLLVFFTAFKGTFPPLIQRAGFLMFMIPLILILFPRSKKDKTARIPITDIIQAIMAALSFGWILFDYGRIAYRIKYVSPVTTLDLIFGTLAIIFVFEACRRTIGWVLVIITSIFIAYIFLGSYFSGILSFKTIPYSLFIEQLYLVEEGIFSVMIGMGASYIFTFVAFGAFLRISGADRHYIDLCLALAGRSRGGAAKTGIIGGALMGMITGSTISNVVTIGSLTIPMMKESGYKAKDAAAIMTAASTGGAITPPVMGAGVYIMSAITGIPLLKILIYSAIPAILYYASLFGYVEIKANKYGLKGLSKDQLPRLKSVFQRSFHLFIPLIILIILLALKRSAFIASAFSTLLIVPLSLLRKDTRMGVKKLVRSLEESSKDMMALASVCACAGMVLGIITLSGLIMKITSVIIITSHGFVFVALLLLALLSTVMGMGMPVTISYILVVTLGAPALTQLGVSLMAAHLAIFWFSQTSTITPPVCMTAFVAAEIAQEKHFMKVGWAALNAGKFLYIIPFLFVFSPLLSENIAGPIKVLVQAIPLLIAITILSEGYLFDHLKLIEWIMTSLSTISFGIAIISKQFSGTLSFTIFGIFAAGIVFYSQKKRAMSSKKASY